MVNLREKGKIPRNEWPRILSKYASGESVAQIGRDYGCTAPAIRYIIKRVGTLKSQAANEAASERKVSPASTSRRAISRNIVLDRDANASLSTGSPQVATAAEIGANATLLGPELRARVTGDVVSVLAALDRAVLEGSVDSLMALREAVDSLMRSAARTRIDLGRILNGEEAAEFGHAAPALENRHRRA
jgi:hypothetical protein